MVALLTLTVTDTVEQLKNWIAESLASHLAIVFICGFAFLYLVVSVANDMLATKPIKPIVPILRHSAATPKHRNVAGNGLHGRIYVLSVFVSTTQRKWNRTTTRRISQKVNEAEAWLKNQAARYGVHNVEFVNGEVGNCADETTIWQQHHPRRGDSINYKMDFINNTLSIAGYSDFYSLANRECSRTGCQQFLVLCFLQSTGRSHAYFPWQHNGLTTSLSILYNWYQGENLKVGTIAHEMLHLFGAWDLYKRKGFPVAKERVARDYYPNSIMIEDHTDDLSSREIDPVTAWRIGICRGEKWFWYFAA